MLIRKISYYLILIFIFLGLSRSFDPLEKDVRFLPNEKILPAIFPNSPLSLILVDSFYTGMFVKTYYLKFYAFQGFQRPEIQVLRTSKSVWRSMNEFQGMAVLQRGDHNSGEYMTPAPPGSIFVGDPTFGTWVKDESEQEVWEFHNAYKHFPEAFGWNKWKPNRIFHKKLIGNLYENIPFHGLNREFGPGGSENRWKGDIDVARYTKIGFWEYSKKFFSIPPWSKIVTIQGTLP